MRALPVALLVASSLLAGCSGGGGGKDEEVVPEEISERELERFEDLVASLPRAYSFPGQAALDPVHLAFNDTIAPGTALGSSEFPNDEGFSDFGGVVIPFDLADEVPVGQPVEVRMKLKWYGDPGASADLDIWVDVPGSHDAFTPDRFDESMNWNIVTKFRVVNTVHREGEPLQVGIQVSNGKDIHPDGIRYSLEVELRFAADVLAPGVAYALTVPEGASGLILESEPVTGDEHIQSEVVLVGPDGLLARHVLHDDIVTETLFLPVQKPGRYVAYAPAMHGGFLRVQADIPNPEPNATPLPTAWTEETLVSDVGLSPAAPGLSMSGTFDTGAAFPLDLEAFLRPTGDPGGLSFQASLNLTSAAGWVTTTETTAGLQSPQGHLGTRIATAHDRSHLAAGPHGWVLTGSGLQDAANLGSASVHFDAGYRILTLQG